MADDKTLPEGDLCHITLEAYKRYVTPYIDDYQQVHEYKKFLTEMEQWQQCCPGKENTSVELRPDKTPVKSLADIPLPPLFSENSRCTYIFDKNLIKNAIAKRWFESYSGERATFWYIHYNNINKNLYDCCTVRFNKCLEQAPPTSAASASCLESFSPEYQRQAAAQRAVAQAKQHPEAVPEILEEKKDVGTEQTSQAQNEGSGGKGLQEAVVSAAPHPGSEVAADVSSESGSAAFVVFGIVALTVAYLLGWPGRSRQARTVSGSVSALIALLVYIISYTTSVAFLPDTRFVNLLLAVTIAVLVVAVRTLVRSQIEIRHRARTPPAP